MSHMSKSNTIIRFHDQIPAISCNIIFTVPLPHAFTQNPALGCFCTKSRLKKPDHQTQKPSSSGDGARQSVRLIIQLGAQHNSTHHYWHACCMQLERCCSCIMIWCTYTNWYSFDTHHNTKTLQIMHAQHVGNTLTVPDEPKMLQKYNSDNQPLAQRTNPCCGPLYS